MIWRTVRRFLRRHGLWPKAARSPAARVVRPWAITAMGPRLYVVEYERGATSVTALLSSLDQESRRRLREAIAARRRLRHQYEAWLVNRDNYSQVPTGKTINRLH